MRTYACPTCGAVTEPEQKQTLAYTIDPQKTSGKIMAFLNSLPDKQTTMKIIVSEMLKQGIKVKKSAIDRMVHYLAGRGNRGGIAPAYLTLEKVGGETLVKIKDEVKFYIKD